MSDPIKPLDGSHYHRHITAAEGRDWPLGPSNLAAHVLTHGSVLVEYYAPRGTDTQKPHTRDELYFVISGEGWFVNGPERRRFAPGDAIFVPAEGNDIGVLPVEIAGILGVDFQLLDDIRGNGAQLRPYPGQGPEICQAQQFHGIPPDPIQTDGDAMLGRLIGGQAEGAHCFT